MKFSQVTMEDFLKMKKSFLYCPDIETCWSFLSKYEKQEGSGLAICLDHMRSAILWEWDAKEAWRWGQTLLEVLVEHATLQAMDRLGSWGLEESSYHLAYFTHLLGSRDPQPDRGPG